MTYHLRRIRWRWLLPAAAVLAAAVLAASCKDGGSESSPTGSPTPEAIPTPDIAALIEQLVLQPADVPDYMEQVSATTTLNEDLANETADPDAELKRLNDSGRLIGLEVNFVPQSLPDSGLTAISSTSRLYSAADGASAAVAQDSATIRGADWEGSYPELTDLLVRAIERPDLADQVIWQRISGTELENTSQMRVEDFVVFRRDRVHAYIRAISLGTPADGPEAFLEEVATLVASHVASIDKALKES